MNCSNCGSSHLATIATARIVELDIVKRYRRCRECFHTFVTYEAKILEVIVQPGKTRPRYLTPEDFEEGLRRAIEEG